MAIAEGNALGKGPVVFELPPAGIANIRDRAAAGDPSFMQLEVAHPLIPVYLWSFVAAGVQSDLVLLLIITEKS